MRVYGKKKTGLTSALVLHFHGGAFVSGDLDSGCTVAGLLADAGAVVVSVAYPLAPENPFPRPLEIGYAALEWIYKNRNKLAGKNAPLYVAGEEAGGNLAAALCVIARDQHHPPLAGQILVSPMLNPCTGTPSLREALGDSTACKWAQGWKEYLGSAYDAQHPYAVPAMAQRLVGIPPALFAVGQTDAMRDEALNYAARLEAAGIPVTRHIFNKVQQWPDALIDAEPQPCPCAQEFTQLVQQFFGTTRCQQ